MSTTAEQIAALETALAKGRLEVETNGHRVKYANPTELLEAIGKLQSKAATRTGQRGFRISKFKGVVE